MGPKQKGKRKSNDSRDSQPVAKTLRGIDGATEELVKCLGVFSFDCSKFSTKTPVEWIKTALIGENAEVKKKNIEDNIRFYLGGGQTEKSIENAVDSL